MVTNAHGRYHDLPMPGWNNRTAVDHGAASTAQTVTSPETVVAYTRPRHLGELERRSASLTAWQLP